MASREDVVALKDELIASSRRPAGWIDGAEFQAVAERPQLAVPVALGITADPDGGPGAALEILIQGHSIGARQAAEQIRDQAEERKMPFVVAEVEEANLPLRQDVEATPGHKMLTGRCDPLHIGASIGHVDGWAGTLGCFVEKGGRIGLLSCSHVLAMSGRPTRDQILIHQPGKPDMQPPIFTGSTRVATLQDEYVEFSLNEANLIDAALAFLKRPDNHLSNVIPGRLGCALGGKRLAAVMDLAEIPLPLRVAKIGRTTGYTEGTLTSILDRVAVRNREIGAVISFNQVLSVRWDDKGTPFTKAGDSGALVFSVDGLRPVGLHFASPGGRSYACPLQKVLDVFEARLI